MILNSFIKKDDFRKEFSPYIQWFTDIGYIDLNNDALWKWSSILYSIDELKIPYWSTCVDIGGGKSPLTRILSNRYVVTNVDKYPGGNWFPLNDGGNYIKSTGINYVEKHITYADQDFFDWAKGIESNSVDFMYDSCSVIHFDVQSTMSKNDGCFKVVQEVNRILKPGGYFIVTSDILHPIHKSTISVDENRGEFLYLENLMSLYNHGDMKTFEEVDLTFDEDFNNNILHIDPNLPNYNKLNHIYYGKEDWQTFCHYEGSCSYNLARGRCVFKKEA
jgi:SAM-dependent methyltransferase